MAELTGNRELSEKIIGAAIAVHRDLGPGFVESIYENAMAIELEALRIPFERQKPIAISYRSKLVGEHRLDFLVAGTVVVELKAVSQIPDVFYSIVRSYMKALKLDDGLILNFAAMPLTIKRVGRETQPAVPAFS